MERLRFVVHLAKESEFNVAPVGLLTTENRRVWGAIHANMSKSNRRAGRRARISLPH